MKKQRSKSSYYFRKYFFIPLKILRISLIDVIRQDGVEHAGYLAFLSFLSLFPFLIFLISIAGYIGASNAGLEIIEILLEALPKDMLGFLKPRIMEIISGPPQQFLTIAIIGIIWTASSSVEGCRTILNRAYRVHFPPPYILRRLLSIVEFFIVVFLMIIGMFIFIIIPDILNFIEKNFLLNFDFNVKFLHFRYFLIFALLFFANSLLYFFIPSSRQKITQTIPGSLLVSVLSIVLFKIFVFYVTNFNQFNIVYGSLAGVISALMFFYLMALIFILGAEFNYHFHRTYQIFLKKN